MVAPHPASPGVAMFKLWKRLGEQAIPDLVRPLTGQIGRTYFPGAVINDRSQDKLTGVPLSIRNALRRLSEPVWAEMKAQPLIWT